MLGLPTGTDDERTADAGAKLAAILSHWRGILALAVLIGLLATTPFWLLLFLSMF